MISDQEIKRNPSKNQVSQQILVITLLTKVPPLDGSKMVYVRLKSTEAIRAYMNYARYGMIILIGFLMLGGFRLIFPVVTTLYVLLGLPMPIL